MFMRSRYEMALITNIQKISNQRIFPRMRFMARFKATIVIPQASL
jgi:hypothetical protein